MSTRNYIRRFLTWFLVCVVSVIVVSVFGEWFIHVADDKGWYRDAGQTWDRGVSAILSFLSSAWLLYPATFLAGIVGGLWADFVLAKRERTQGESSDIATVRLAEDGPLPEHSGEPEYSPVDPPAPAPQFNYPYKKAVMTADVMKPSKEADAPGVVSKVSTGLYIVNEHGKALKNCSVMLVRIRSDGKTSDVGVPLKTGDDGIFDLHPSARRGISFIRRDLRDRVSKPPFLLATAKGDIVLSDNTKHILILELRSEYDHPTKVGLQVAIGVKDDVTLTILGQSV